MKYFSLIFLLVNFLACDEFTEKYLYDEDDSEYSILQEMQAQECIDSSKIFSALESGSGDFESFAGKYYYLEQDDPSIKSYFYISAADSTSMTVKMSSSKSSLNKTIVFEKTDHDTLMSELKIMACNSAYDDYFSASGLSSQDYMTLTWTKTNVTDSDDDNDDGDADEYYERTDSLKFDVDYPLFFFFFNGSKYDKLYEDGSVTTVDDKSTLTIEEIDEDECEDADNCYYAFIADSSDDDYIDTSDNCNVEIVEDLFNSNDYDDQIYTYATADGCTALPSGNE